MWKTDGGESVARITRELISHHVAIMVNFWLIDTLLTVWVGPMYAVFRTVCGVGPNFERGSLFVSSACFVDPFDDEEVRET